MKGLERFASGAAAIGAPVVLAAVVVGGLILPAISSISASREELAALRRRAATLEAELARDLPADRILPPDAEIKAANQSAALSLLGAHIDASAHFSGVELRTSASISPADQAGLATGFWTATGPEPSIVKFIAAVENVRPIVRFRRWKLQAVDPTKDIVQFEFEAIASWSKDAR